MMKLALEHDNEMSIERPVGGGIAGGERGVIAAGTKRGEEPGREALSSLSTQPVPVFNFKPFVVALF
jgi:hypothetical protein